MSHLAVAPSPTSPAEAKRKLLGPFSFLPGILFWGLIGAGIYTENDAFFTAGVLVLVAMLGITGFFSLKASSKRRAEMARVWRDGFRSTAEVLSIKKEGGMNDHPRVRFRLAVTPPQAASGPGASYEAETVVIVDQLAVPRIQPGASIDVRIDPRDPSQVVIDESLTYRGYEV